MTDRETIWIGDWRLEPGIRTLSRGDAVHRIEPKMLDVLLILVERAEQPVGREELERSVWSGAAVGTELLNRTVWKLRKVLGDDPAEPSYIETIPRVGYRLVAPVHLGEKAPTPVAATRRSPATLALGLSAVALAIIAGTWASLRSGDPGSDTPPPARVAPLTATPGYEGAPDLSPDGRRVAYQRYDPDQAAPTWDLALVELEGGTARILEGPPDAHEYAPAWSSGGDSLVFLRRTASTCQILVRGMDGHPVPVADCALDQSHEVRWAPDGSFLVASEGGGQTLGLSRLRRDGSAPEPLTAPPLGFTGDRHPRVSPDGSRVAFLRERSAGIGDLYVMDWADPSDPVRITFDQRAIGGLSWTADGAGLVFSSNRGGSNQLWRVSVDGSGPSPVPMTGRNASAVTVSGEVIVYEEYFGDSDVWVLAPDGALPESWGGSSRSEWGVAVSPRGDRIAFLSDRSGSAEVWIGPIAGSPPTRLTRLDGAQVDPPRWSPDGTSLVFSAAPEGNFDVFVVPAAGGDARRLTRTAEDERVAAWWDDEVVYSANRTGTYELWASAPKGGPARRLTVGGGWAARASADGDALYFTRADEPGLWRLRPGEPRVEQVWSDLHPADWANWEPTSAGVLHLRAHGAPLPQVERLHVASGRVDTLLVLDADVPDRAGVSRAPDGRIFFSRVVRSESDLWIVR